MTHRPTRSLPLVAVAIAAAAAALATTAFIAPPAEAAGKRYGHSKGYYGKSDQHGRYPYADRNRNGDKPPGRAVFANEVDLGAPGGTKRFFELLQEENR